MRDAEWAAGLALESSISQEMLADLAAENIIERRTERRKEVARQVQVKAQLSNEPFTAELKDYSRSGFRVIVQARLADIGDRIMMQLHNKKDVVFGRVCWVKEVDDTRLKIGCSYLAERDYNLLMTTMDPGSHARWLRTIRKYRPTRWRSVAAIVFLLLTYQLIDFVRTHPDVVYQVDQVVVRQILPAIKEIWTDIMGGPDTSQV